MQALVANHLVGRAVAYHQVINPVLIVAVVAFRGRCVTRTHTKLVRPLGYGLKLAGLELADGTNAKVV